MNHFCYTPKLFIPKYEDHKNEILWGRVETETRGRPILQVIRIATQ